MPFHPVRFPLDIALGAVGGPQRLTDVTTLASGREERNSRWARSRRRYNAGYGIKSKADMQAVLVFFEERRGRFHSFLWRDALDHASRNDGQAPTGLDQQIGTGDGETTAFQLTKRYGGSFDPWMRQITKPVAGSVVIAVDGVAASGADFAVDPLTGIVTFDAAPADGQAVTAGFLFDVPVRFDTDRLDIELSGFDAAVAPNISLIEVLDE
ncbi:DUF2460 domain-containing protein [Pelagibacterium limicola]|uniref:DUF2460 domain-containing protein n=1 Tax=Pelagibacterium limicola TaxID=2791022 RepID=UPI0018AFD972|nr:DUF2460 domain-containing protein [Pelagibacterium limicola]